MRTRIWLSCALAAVLTVGCTDDPAQPPPDEPEGAPEVEQVEPEPEPLQDVEGTVDEVLVTELSATGSGLYPDGSGSDARVPTDERILDDTVATTAAWLDEHLTDAQSGGPGLVAAVDLDGDPAAASGALTGPEHPVTSATYDLNVGVRGVPEWVEAEVTVRREDGEMTATFIFVVWSGDFSLVAARVGDGTPVVLPPDDPDDETS